MHAMIPPSKVLVERNCTSKKNGTATSYNFANHKAERLTADI